MRKSKSLDIEKVYSPEAEAGVLGSIVVDSPCIPKVLSMLPRSDMFFLPENQVIFEAEVKLYIGGKPIDAIALRTELKEQGKLEEVGGVQYIAKLMDSVPSSANAVYYAGIVRSKAKEREVHSAVEQIHETVSKPGPVDEKIQAVQQIVMELEMTTTGPDYVELAKEAVSVAAKMGQQKDDSIPTGFRDLDRLVHGFYPGEFIIVAGRPSMGKSALMLDMVLSVAKAGTGSLICSLEMTERSLIERAICNLACVDMAKLQCGDGDEWEKAEIKQKASELQKYNVIVSKIGSTPEQVAGLIHRLRQTHGIGIAFVDYLQLMTAGKKTESRQQEVSLISRKLKATALRENIPIVALSQLNRQVDARDDHRPRMSDLRESGSLEQDADLVLFCFRNDYYRKDQPEFKPTGVAEVIVSKNRRGRVGKVQLVFVHDYAQFRDLCYERVGAG